MSGVIAEAFSVWRECRAEFDLYLEQAYERAAEACNDRLVNDRGRRAGVEPLSLFMGPWARARAYASPELLKHWERFPRVTYAEFERQWVAGCRPDGGWGVHADGGGAGEGGADPA